MNMTIRTALGLLLIFSVSACGSPPVDGVTGATPVYEGKSVPTVRFEEVKRFYDGVDGKQARFVDARFVDDGEKLPGAVFLNTQSPEADVLRLLPDKQQLIVVYCSSQTCPASHWMAQRLIEMGYQRVFEFAGGIDEWRNRGGRLVPVLETEPKDE
jgi:rhodanese-related sulfurtransferase